MLSELLDALGLYERWTGRQSKSVKRARKDQKKRDKAIESVLEAVTDTRAYLYDRQSGSRLNRRRETDISQKWRKAAIRVRNIDRRLSGILVMKSRAWADPSLWDDPAFEQVEIKLETIEDQCLWHLEQDL